MRLDVNTLILRDFREVEIRSSKKKMTRRLLFQDKGQAAMVRAFLRAVKDGDGSPIAFGEISAVTLATFRAVESLRSGSIFSV